MTTPRQTKEAQYQVQLDTLEALGPVTLGPTASHLFRSDPRHLGFTLARYKFCAKMLAGKASVLEVGCGDGFGCRVVLQEVGRVTGLDFDPSFIEWASENARREGLAAEFRLADVMKGIPGGPYDAAYSLDVIEHIPQAEEHVFLGNIAGALARGGVCIIGSPNLTSQEYASVWSKAGHVNCKTGPQLRALMARFFDNVFLFGMNDEVLHTGYEPMAHYLLAVGAGVRPGGA